MAATLSVRPFTRATALLVVWIAMLPGRCQTTLYPETLYRQSIARALIEANPHLEMLVLDIKTGQPLVNSFADANAALPPGSLLKPFLAATPPLPSLRVLCRGHADHCWTAHGSVGLVDALAGSCNAFFLALAAQLESTRIPWLPAAPPQATPADLIGLTGRWRISPLVLARAYAELLGSPATPPAVHEGMLASARHGTALRVGPHPGGVLAKTGTAPCVDPLGAAPVCHGSGDGLVVAAVPAVQPTLLVLIRKRGTTGAATAAAAGPLLDELKRMKVY